MKWFFTNYFTFKNKATVVQCFGISLVLSWPISITLRWKRRSYSWRLLTPTYLKGEGIRVVPSLLQQHLVHAALGRFVALRVDLDLFDPDVLPEAETHHVQVVAAIAEGARQLHKHWAGDTACYFTQSQQHLRSYSRRSNLSGLQSLLCPAWRCHLLKVIVILGLGCEGCAVR